MKKTETSPENGKLKIPKSYLILGGGSILVIVAVFFYASFFYLTLPSHQELDKAGQAIRHVPLPVPPTTFLPSGSGKTIDTFENSAFVLKASPLSKSKTGFDATFILTAKISGTEGDGLSFAFRGKPRWVDANRNSGEGSMDLSTGTRFRKGIPETISIHFARMPTTASFDLYLALVGVHGVKGDRYLVHLSNLKIQKPQS